LGGRTQKYGEGLQKKDLFGDFTARISTKLKAAEMYASSMLQNLSFS